MAICHKLFFLFFDKLKYVNELFIATTWWMFNGIKPLIFCFVPTHFAVLVFIFVVVLFLPFASILNFRLILTKIYTVTHSFFSSKCCLISQWVIDRTIDLKKKKKLRWQFTDEKCEQKNGSKALWMLCKSIEYWSVFFFCKFFYFELNTKT